MDFMACLLQDTPINPYVQLVDAMTRFITPLWMGLALIMVSYRCDALLPSASTCMQQLNSPAWSRSGNSGMWQAPSWCRLPVTCMRQQASRLPVLLSWSASFASTCSELSFAVVM